MRIVLDTNVLVSALLNPQGPPAQVLELILSEKITLLMDLRILLEYREVLNRKEFLFDPAHVDFLLSFFEGVSEEVTCEPFPYPIPDPDDLPFLEVSLAGEADSLITGNKRDYGRPPKGLKILNPHEFLDFYRKQHLS